MWFRFFFGLYLFPLVGLSSLPLIDTPYVGRPAGGGSALRALGERSPSPDESKRREGARNASHEVPSGRTAAPLVHGDSEKVRA